MITQAPFPPHVPLFIPSVDGYRTASFASMGGIGQFAAIAGNAWPTANLAIYVPIRLPWNYPVKRVFIVPTSAVGNVDIGIFHTNGSKLVSTGAFAASGVNVVQYQTVDWLIPKGAWYMGISCSSASNTIFAGLYATLSCRQCGLLQQATAHPLPATMVGATVANAYWPFFGLTRTSSGF